MTTENMVQRRDVLRTAAGAGLGLLGAGSVWAQASAWPTKPVNLVVPFPAGGGTDAFARPLAAQFSKATGKTLVIDNRGGAGGTVGASFAARAAADGYTLFMGGVHHSIAPAMYPKLDYDIEKDFIPLALLARVPQVLVVNPASPHKSVGDLVVFAKKNPGKLTFGSGSASSRVAGEMFKQLAGVDILHVPYKSNPFAITDLLAGQIDLMITDTSTGMPQITAGKLRALGYSTKKRSAQLPEVPTIDEAGVKGYDMGYWFAAYAPAGTPAVVVNRLNELMQAATKSATAKSFFDMSGSEAWTTTPADLAKFQAAETLKWGKVIKAAGIEAE